MDSSHKLLAGQDHLDLQRVLVVQLDVSVLLADADDVDKWVVAEAEVLGVASIVPNLKKIVNCNGCVTSSPNHGKSEILMVA